MIKRISFLALTLLACAGSVNGLVWELNVEFSGAAPSSGAPKATFVDMGSYVELTMDLTNLSGGEHVTEWYFNFTGDFSQLQIAHDSGEVAVNGVQVQLDTYKADGDGDYDIKFSFAPPPGNDKFIAGETSVYKFSYADESDISELDFVSYDVGGNKGDFYSAAHVQGIADTGLGTSGWMGNGTIVPEPGTYLMLGSTLLFAAAARRRQEA